MKSIALAASLALVVTVAWPAWASSAAPVERLFAALAKHDFTSALAQTSGPAAVALGGLLGTIDREAARAGAAVELDVRDLQVHEGVVDADGKVPVDVRYDIALIGRRFLFKRLVRHLIGSARILVDGATGRIVSLGDFST